jgi:hypothetical protein
MKTKYLQTVAATIAFATFGLVFGANSPDSTLTDVAGYRNWTRVSEKPVAVPSFAG